MVKTDKQTATLRIKLKDMTRNRNDWKTRAERAENGLRLTIHKFDQYKESVDKKILYMEKSVRKLQAKTKPLNKPKLWFQPIPIFKFLNKKHGRHDNSNASAGRTKNRTRSH